MKWYQLRLELEQRWNKIQIQQSTSWLNPKIKETLEDDFDLPVLREDVRQYKKSGELRNRILYFMEEGSFVTICASQPK